MSSNRTILYMIGVSIVGALLVAALQYATVTGVGVQQSLVQPQSTATTTTR